jgi:hypothetical protein
LDVHPQNGPPRLDEAGRMPAWLRAEAFFGTNNLRLAEVIFNSRDAVVRLESLDQGDINPCFQALVCAHLLLPEVRTFSVHVGDSSEASLVVSCEALEQTLYSWTYAIGTLDRMPLATFLPTNFDARRRQEAVTLAVRSVAWIAIDDLFDAIDGAPGVWDAQTMELLSTRLRLIELAIRGTISAIPEGQSLRLASVLEDVQGLQAELAGGAQNGASLESLPIVRRLRHQYGSWGPVRRLPTVTERDDANGAEFEPQPAIQTARHSDLWFRTL